MQEFLADQPIWLSVFLIVQGLLDLAIFWIILFHIWQHHELEDDWDSSLEIMNIPRQREAMEDRLPGRHRLT